MDRCRAFSVFGHWVRAIAHVNISLDSLFIAFHGGPNFSRLSMGCAAVGNGLPGGFSRAAGIGSAFSTDEGFFANHSLAALVAVIPADVLVRNGQVEQW